MNNFNDKDLYESYFTVFPNLSALFFCYFGLICFILGVGVSFIMLCLDEIKDFLRQIIISICLSIIYIILFIGYFSYCLYEYVNIYVNRNPENLINIRADYFLEELLEEIYDRHSHRDYIFYIIILLSCSFFILIIALIFAIRIIKK